MVKISINQKECIGCSYCGGCAPDIFQVDGGDFKCKLKKDGKLVDSTLFNLSPEQLKQIKEAVEGCPTKAIELSE